MGMDIYGRNPKLKSKKPEIDFTTASDEAKKIYFEENDKWEKENPGYYFRANVWSWRPINFLLDYVNFMYKLNYNFDSYGFNSGAGLETQEECNIVADKLEETIQNLHLKDDIDRIYLSLGMWTSETGSFVDDKLAEELNKQFPEGTVMDSAVVASNGELVQPAWSVSASHLREFIKFLRHCGGFEIW